MEQESGIIRQRQSECGSLTPRTAEVYRYLGYAGVLEKGTIEEPVEEAVAAAVLELGAVAWPQAVYTEYPVRQENGSWELGFCRTDSRDIGRRLEGCERIVLFAATIGSVADRLIQRAARKSALLGATFQAAGAMYIEVFCDQLNAEINEELEQRGYQARPRFSPGYGDFPLEVQKDIFRVLPCAQRIGLTLRDTLVMAPSKSVTAVIGYQRRKA